MDPRDEVWDATWRAYYDTFYQEILSERLVLRWLRFDEVSKILIALTASGSAISGWAMWSDQDLRVLWAIIAGFGAVLAVIHKSLDVSRKLTDWGSSRSQFSITRIDFEVLLNRIKFEPNFEVNPVSRELAGLQKRYAEAYQNTKVDPFLTRKLKSDVQDQLNSLVASIEPGGNS